MPFLRNRRLSQALLALSLALATSPVVRALPIDASAYGVAFAAGGDNVAGEIPRRFCIAVSVDPGGRIWVGTEQQGAWCFDPRSHNWSRFSSADGLGDDSASSIAGDRQGRVWVGHLGRGVSVFDGQTWKNYDVLEGPLGGRVLHIVVSPIDGDVWMATNRGLTRYSPASNTWSYITRADGLPSDELNRIAFDPAGNLYIATQCDGVAMADAADGYKTWRIARGTDRAPLITTGQGLPSNLVNDVLVARDGTIYAATAGGLARSSDRGRTWTFHRGADWQKKVEERAGGPPADWSAAGQEPPLLLEDWSTSVGEDAAGRIWVGHRMTAIEVIDPATNRRLSRAGPAMFVSAILCTPGVPVALAAYGEGLSSGPVELAMDRSAKFNASEPPATPPPMPAPAAAPTTEQLRTLAAVVKATPANQPLASYEGEDPATQGEWVGRYGRRAAYRPGLSGDAGSAGFASGAGYSFNAHLGPHQDATSELYQSDTQSNVNYYYGSTNSTDPRSPYDAARTRRMNGEWNDSSWDSKRFSNTFEGPDLWLTVTVPEGAHRVSVLFYNYDGHGKNQRRRDYLVELKAWDDDRVRADAAPALARTRVSCFWMPVSKRFVLSQGKYLIKIGRCYSNVTKCSAVMFDQWKESAGAMLPGSEDAPYDPPLPPVVADTNALSPATELWAALDAAPATVATGLNWQARLLAYRYVAKANPTDESARGDLLAAWRWALPVWTASDQAAWQQAILLAAENQRKKQPELTNPKN